MLFHQITVLVDILDFHAYTRAFGHEVQTISSTLVSDTRNAFSALDCNYRSYATI